MSRLQQMGREAAQVFHHAQAQLAEIPAGAKITGVGFAGTGASVLLQNISLAASILVAGLTIVYMAVKIYETRTLQRLIHGDTPRTRREDCGD